MFSFPHYPRRFPSRPASLLGSSGRTVATSSTTGSTTGRCNSEKFCLPAGWRERVEPIFEGQALILSTLGRPDLIKSKLFALCDRGTDLPDCIALAPTVEELAECLPWLERQDGNELWPDHVRNTVAELGRRLGHGV